MWRRCTCLAVLVVLSILIQGAAADGAFNALKDPALVGWWSFDEGTGDTAADSSPYGRDGQLRGGAAWAPGRFGGGIQLNGTSAYVAVPSFPVTTGAVTMVAWVNGWKANSWAALVTGHPARLEMCFGDNSTLHYAWNNDSSATWSWAGAPVIPQDTWAMVAITIDAAQAIAYVYTDAGGLAKGVNAMAHIQQTYSTLQIGWSFDTRYVRGIMDEVAVYSRALTEEEMLILAKGPQDPALAGDPSPDDKAADIPRDTAFRWRAGETATAHDVYLGTSFADVNNASRAGPTDLLVSQGQADTTFNPALLELGMTYYWRIDEVDDAGTVLKGNVWSFTVEPFSYPVTPAAAIASSAQAGMGPENTINGSGLNVDDQHSTELTQMWMSSGAPQPNWIQYEFDRVYKLDKLLVWNSNQLIETFLGFGARNVTVEYSVDGETWTVLEGVPEFAKAEASPTYTANTTVEFGGVMARFVKLTINRNWGGMAPQSGLSEVRFFYVPVQAFASQPAVAATDIGIDTELSWRPGREAQSHEVYFGADAEALVLMDTVTECLATPGPLDFAATYFWKVNEIGGDGPYEGEVWSFTTQEYATIDDFEGYNDDDNRIYDTWIDGLTDPAKGGSQVGYDVSPFAEKATVHGGRQAMPLIYDNSASPFLSEAERTFASPQDWTIGGADSLSLYFQGLADNSAEGLYVTIKDSAGKSKTVASADAAATTVTDWQQGTIPLSEFASAGVKINAVKSVTIGVGNRSVPVKGGAGKLIIDDVGFGRPLP